MHSQPRPPQPHALPGTPAGPDHRAHGDARNAPNRRPLATLKDHAVAIAAAATFLISLTCLCGAVVSSCGVMA